MTNKLRLRDYMDDEDGFGNMEGRQVHQRLLEAVEARPEDQIIPISLEGVERTDASFPRESVVELARRYRKLRGFFLVDVDDQDLLDNWDAAALKREQPLLVWWGDRYQVLGPQPTRGNQPLFKYVLSMPNTTTAAAAQALDLKVNNVSTKLKQLLEAGFILRCDEVSPTGGVEYVYFRIK